MAVIGDAYLDVHGRLDSFDRSVTSGIGRIAKRAAGLFAAAFAASKAFDFVGDALAEAREAAQVGRLTEAVVKSTGGAANVSAEQLGKLSERLSNIAAVDDEVVQSAGNVLLTFTKVRNEVGAGNDIFNQGAEAALNMSAALKQDLQGATLQVGKALNDPIKGVTALARAGVSFTQQQKDQIKAMQQSGDLLGAQKIILSELETQFGGAAAAAADPMARLGVVVGNLKERLGTALLPVVERVATWLGDRLPGYLDTASSWFTTLREAVRPVTDFLGNAATQLGNLLELFRSGDGDANGFAEILDNILGNTGNLIGPLSTLYTTVSDVVTAFRQDWLPVLREVADELAARLTPIVVAVASFIGDNLRPILLGLGAAFVLLAAPISAVVAAAVYAYTQFEVVRDVIATVLEFITGTAVPGIAGFAEHVRGSFSDALTWVQQNMGAIREAIDHVLRVVRTIVETTLGVIAALWRQWGDDLSRIVGTVWNGIRETIDNAVRFVQSIIRVVLSAINGDWGQAWNALKDAVGAVWNQIGNIVSTAAGVLRGLLGGLGSTIKDLFGAAWNALPGIVSGAWGAITGAVSNGAVAMFDFFAGLPARIATLLIDLPGKMLQIGWDIIDGLVNGIRNAANDILEGVLDWVTDKIPDWKGPMAKDRRLLEPTGKAIMEGLVAGIRAGTSDVRAWLGAVTANIVGDIGTALGAIRSLRSAAAARAGLASAQGDLSSLRSRAGGLPAEIAAAEREVQRQQTLAAAVSPSERLAVNRAMQDVLDKTEALKEMQAEGTATALELAIATDELHESRVALEAAEDASVGTTQELADAQERLRALREEQVEVTDAIADAERRVDDATMGVVEAQTQLLSTGANLAAQGPQMVDYFMAMAEAAGVSRDAIRDMLVELENAGATVSSDQMRSVRPRKPGTVSPRPTDSLRDRVARIGTFVQEDWSPSKIDGIVRQIEAGTRSLESVAADVAARIRSEGRTRSNLKGSPTVQFVSLDTPKLQERLQLESVVGKAVSKRSRLKPVAG